MLAARSQVTPTEPVRSPTWVLLIPARSAQLRPDVDDIYELLDPTNRTITTISATQRRHGTRLEEIQQALDLQNGRLDRIDDTQRQILAPLRDGSSH